MNTELRLNLQQVKIDSLLKELNQLKEEHQSLVNEVAECNVYTAKFLTACSKRKIKKVSINKYTDEIYTAKHWPFRHDGNVFTDEAKSEGYPAIWRVVEELGYHGGCGNSNQAQLNDVASARLIDGVYEFKDKKWHKVG